MSTEGPFGRRDDPLPPAPPPEAGRGSEPLTPAPPRPPARASNFTWLLGVLCILGLGYITLNTVRTDAPGSRGVPVGQPMPAFTAPLAASERRCEGELCNANVTRRAGEDVRRAACEVQLPDALNVCELWRRGPVVLAFVATRSELCERQVDVLQRVRRRFPTVQFAAVSVRGDRDDLRRTISKRGWTLPVAHDTNGAVSNAYSVAICPTITFARQGGRVTETSLDLLDEAALTRRIQALVR